MRVNLTVYGGFVEGRRSVAAAGPCLQTKLHNLMAVRYVRIDKLHHVPYVSPAVINKGVTLTT